MIKTVLFSSNEPRNVTRSVGVFTSTWEIGNEKLVSRVFPVRNGRIPSKWDSCIRGAPLESYFIMPFQSHLQLRQ